MRKIFKVYFFLTCFLTILFIQNLNSQIQIKTSVVGNGAGYMSNSDHRIGSTLGQSAIGLMSDNNYHNYSGFWYEELFYLPIAEEMNFDIPKQFRVFQNYPNPFNPRTIIKYELPITNFVELSIYNLRGQKVVTLVSENQNAGKHQVEWDASSFSSGVYYYIIEAGEFQDVKKMILLR